MAKKNQPRVSQQDSVRWPRILSNVEAADSLVQSDGWLAMEQEWKDQLDTLVYQIVHKTTTMEQTNFLRGQAATLEMLLGFREDLKDWKESH